MRRSARAGVLLAGIITIASLAASAAGAGDRGTAEPSRGWLGWEPDREEGPYHPVRGSFDYGGAEGRFGASRSDHVHEGQDVFAEPGTPLVAVRDGVVLEAGTDAGRGNYVVLHSSEARQTYVYMHMIRPPDVRAGQRVPAGRKLGGVGCTGSCWGDHLHFEMHRGRDPYDHPRDPLPLLRSWRQAPRGS